MKKQFVLKALPFAMLLLPSLALASGETDLISQLAGLFYIVAGLTLVAALLLMGGGTMLWMIRFGTDINYRDDAIRIMEYAVATLFTLILALGIVEFVQTHTSVTLYILSVASILLLAWLIITSGALSGEGEKKEEH